MDPEQKDKWSILINLIEVLSTAVAQQALWSGTATSVIVAAGMRLGLSDVVAGFESTPLTGTV